MCLEHSKPKHLICIKCKVNVCETCALFGSHKGHPVQQKRELVQNIHKRMEMLMDNYQTLQKGVEEIRE